MNVIRINRKILFDPVRFMQHQGLEIEEQDERSIMIEEVDLSKITLESMLKGDMVISGERTLKTSEEERLYTARRKNIPDTLGKLASCP
jgi:ethanolamine utilization protein EutA (predicted chaperonin)